MLGGVLGAYWGSQATNSAIDGSHLLGYSVEQLVQAPEPLPKSSWLTNLDLNSSSHYYPELLSGTWAVTTLPSMLFFHDDALKQQQALIQAMQPWPTEASTQESLLALGYAIAQACKQQLNPSTLLSEISAYLELSIAPDQNQGASSMSWLAATQTLFAEATDLQAAVTTIQQWQRQPNIAGAIALAFYCFLTTPETWQLSVQRAGQTGYSLPLVAALTGALSGAYNSEIGIPIAWLTAYEHHHTTTIEPSQMTISGIRQQATRLLASWSGSYDVATVTRATAAVAAPQVIRPR